MLLRRECAQKKVSRIIRDKWSPWMPFNGLWFVVHTAKKTKKWSHKMFFFKKTAIIAFFTNFAG